VLFYLLITAPSSTPSNVSLEGEPTSRSIHLKWDKVENEGPGCIQVEGYTVRYNSTLEGYKDIIINGNEILKHQINGLTPNTDYSIAVAAYNFAGNGTFSSPIIVKTAYEGNQCSIIVT